MRMRSPMTLIRARDDPPGPEPPADLNRQAVAASAGLCLDVLQLLEHLRATDDRDVTDVSQIRSHRLGDAGPDPVVSRIAGDVGKGQHRNRPLAGLDMRRRPHTRRRGAGLDTPGGVTKRVVHVARGVVSRYRRLLQRASHDVLDVERDGRIHLHGRRGFLMQDLIEDGSERAAAERQRRGQHLVQDDTETPEIDAVIDRIAPQLLWRHVGDRAQHHTRRSDEEYRAVVCSVASTDEGISIFARPKSRTFTSPRRV